VLQLHQKRLVAERTPGVRAPPQLVILPIPPSHRHTEAGARAALQIIEAEDGMHDHVIRSTSTERAVVISPEMIKWTPILDGADVGILSGDPDLPGGEYAVRFRTSREIRVPPTGIQKMNM
jgi:hypothetical protein